MKKIKLLIIAYLLLSVLSSCGGLSDAGKILRNEKQTNTDEFLIKKKGPLSQPPDFNKIPEPNSQQSSANKESDVEIEKILNVSKSNKSKSKSKSTSTENSILNQIKK